MVKKQKLKQEDEEEEKESFLSKLKSVFFPPKKGKRKMKVKKKREEEEEEKPKMKVKKKREEEEEEEEEEETETNEEEEESEDEEENEQEEEEEEEKPKMKVKKKREEEEEKPKKKINKKREEEEETETNEEEEESEEEEENEQEEEEEEEKPKMKVKKKREEEEEETETNEEEEESEETTKDDDSDDVFIEQTNPNKSLLDKINPFNVFDKRIKGYIEYYGDDIGAIHKSYKSFLRVILPVTALIMFLGFLKIRFFLFSIPFLVLLAYFYPLLYTYSKAQEQKKNVNNEAPFIALIAYVNSLIDKGLNKTLKDLSKIKEMKVARIEQMFIEKMTTYMNKTFEQAIARRARVHANDFLGRIYSNYLAAMDLGFTIRDRMRDITTELLNEWKETFKAYTDKSAELTELIFAVFLLIPMTLIGFSFTFKVSLIEIIAPLLVAPALYFAVTSSQPFRLYNLKYGKYLPLLLLVPIIILIPHFSFSIKIILIMALFTALSSVVYSQITLADSLEKSLPILLKETAEYMRLGYTVQDAILRVRLASKRVTEAIQKYIKDPENVNSPSALFNLAFKMIFITAEPGASSAALQELGNIVSEIVFAKNNTVRQLRLFDILTILTPVLMWMTFGILGKINGGHAIPIGVIIGSYSLVSAMLFNKISRFTLLYFPTMLLVTIITVALLFLPIQLPG